MYIFRLFYLQVIDNSYKFSAENIVLRTVTQYPARGIIRDRNAKLLVYNDASYDLMVIPRQAKNIDTIRFCKLTGISIEDYKKHISRAKRYSWYKPSVFIKQISKEDFGKINEEFYRFPGFYAQSRTLRKYPWPIAGHLLGSIGEVNRRDLDKDEFYHSGDYIGKSGIEKYYEKFLRGEKGSKLIEVDVHNREKGSYQKGKYDTLAIPGKDLVLSIDAELQYYGEQLMQNKKGSIVAIDPKSGEILALISSPGFDPNLMVGRKRSENYGKLLHDTLKPLLNRAIGGTYPPGSTFKMINALVALQQGVIKRSTEYSCQGPLSRPIKCTHNHYSPLDLDGAITQSCNPYFWKTFKNTISNPKFDNSHDGFQAWYENIVSFGFGHKFKTDIPFEVSGNIPTVAYYDKLYRGSWNALTIRSLAIGQGEILVTPIQLANMTAIIANKGYYLKPHFLREMEDNDTLKIKYSQKNNTTIESKYFDIVIRAMVEVFEGEHGTARRYQMDNISQAGKTGTVQNPHGEDHSLFIEYAPVENPQIAISVIVENGGFGSRWAAPIASLMVEKYLSGEIKRKKVEKKILEGNLISKSK
jgi:penicillin-binding protein 2